MVITDNDYDNDPPPHVVLYNCRLHESESGFVVLIDRRNDGWGAVRSILLKMSVSHEVLLACFAHFWR